MQASMSEFVQFLEGRDGSVHQSTENEELMEPRSPSGREDSRALSKQLEDSNKLPPPSYIDELVFGFLGISEAEQNTAATSLCIPRDVVPSGRSAFKPSEPKTYAIDGSNESYGGNWDEGLLENDYDYPCLSSYAHEVVITTETQTGTAVKETADRLVANANDYSLDVLAQEKLDVQGFQVEEALHMASAPNVMCKSVIDTLQEDSTFFEDMGFDMRNSSELKDCKSYYESSTSEMNVEGSPEDVSPACSNLHIVPMSDGMMEVTASPPEEFAVPLSRDGGIEMGQVSSPDVAKVPICTGVGQPSPMSPPSCQAVASTSQRLAFDLSSCCGPFGAVVKNQIVLPYSGDVILSENDSLDSQDYGMPKLVRADDPPPRVTDQIYDSPPELDPVDHPSTTTTKKGVKTTTTTLASAAGEDLLKSLKKITLDVVPETIQEATSQEELNDSLGKIVPSFTPDISNQMPAYMNDIYDVRNISLESTCSTLTTNAGSGGSLPLLPVTEEPKVYKTFKKVSPITPIKKTKALDVKSKDSCGVDKGFVQDLLRSVNGGPNSLSGPNCVVEFTNKAPMKPSVRKDLVAEVSIAHEKRCDSPKSETSVGTLLFNTSASTSSKNLHTASAEPKNTPNVGEASSLKLDFKSLPDLPTLLDISDVRSMDKVPSNLCNKGRSSLKHTSLTHLSSSEHLSASRGKTVSDQSNKPDNTVQIVKKAGITCNTSSGFTSSTSLKKTTTIIANVAQDLVNGVKVRVPQIIDDIKMKKSDQIKMQDKPAASTSVKVISKKLMSPQELKVSLPISSLDLLSVKPIKIIETTKSIEVGYKENVNVILGVGTPTMAQRKQYAVPCIEADSKSSLTEVPINERKNGQHLAKTSSKRSMTNPSGIPCGKVEVSNVTSPTKSLDTFSRSRVLSNDVIGSLAELTVCNQAVKNTMSILSCEKNTDVQSPRPLKSWSDPKAQIELKSTEDEVSKDRVKSDLITMSGVAAIPLGSDTNKKPSSSKVATRVSDKIYITNENVGVSLNAKMIKGLLDEINLTRGKDGLCSLNLPSKHLETGASNVVTEFDVHEKPSCGFESSTSIPTGTKNCSIDSDNLPNQITDTSTPIPSVLVSRKMENIPSQIDKKVETQNKGESSSKLRTGLLGTDEMEQTGSLKEHPVIDLVNSLIHSSSKLPDLFEEPSKQRETRTAVLEKQHTALSEDVAVKEKTSSSERTFEKLKVKSRNTVGNQKVKTSRDIALKRKTTSAQTGENQKAIVPQDAAEKHKTSSPDTEKPKTNSSHSSDGKVNISVSKEVTIAQKSVPAQFVFEETKTTSQSEVQKPKSVAQDVDENQKTQPLTPLSSLEGIENQKLVTPSVFERPKTSVSQGLTEKSVAPTLSQDDIKEQKSKVQDVTQKQTVATSRDSLGKSITSLLLQDLVEKKTNVLQDVVEKQKTTVSEDSVEKKKETEDSVLLKPVMPTDTIQKQKATSSQAMVDKSKTALAEGVVAQTKPESSQVEVVEQKTVISHGMVDKTKTASSESVVAKPKTEPSQVQVVQMKATSQVEVDQKKAASLHVVVEKPKTTPTVVVVDKTKTAVSKVVVEKTKMTPPQDVGGKHKEKVQDMVKKENTHTSQDVVETKKSTFTKEEVSERKLSVDKSKTVSSEVVADKMKTVITQDVSKKYKEKVQDTVEKESTQSLQEVAKKNKSAHYKEEVVERKPGVDKSKISSSKFVVDKMKMPTPQDMAGTHVEKDQKTVAEKKNCVVTKEQVEERNCTVNKLQTVLSKVVAAKTETTLPQDVAEEHKAKVQDSVTLEVSSQTSLEVLKKRKDAQSKEEVVERKPLVGKLKTVTSKVVAEKTRTATTTQDVVKKPKMLETVEKDSTRNLQGIVEKNEGAQPKEKAVERKPVVDKSKNVTSEVADKMRMATPQDVAEKPKGKVQGMVVKESTRILQEMVEKKKGALSKEEAVERKPAVDKSKTVSRKVDKTKTTTPPEVAGKLQDTIEKESARTLQEVVEKKKGAWSKVVVERKPVADKPKTVLSKVVADETKMFTAQDMAKNPKEKLQNTVERESTRTLQELFEKKKGAQSKVEVVERQPVVDKPKTVSLKVVVDYTNVGEKPKEKMLDALEKDSTQTLQQVVEKKKCEQSKEEVVERKPVVDKHKTVSSKVVVDNTKSTSPQDVAEKPKDAVEREITRTLQEVVEKKKCEQSKEGVVERKPAVDKPKTLSSKVVVDNTKTTSPQDVAEKPKGKMLDTLEKESPRTLQEVVETKKCEQSKEEVVERKPAVDKPKTLSSKVVVDNSKTTSPQDVAVKPKDAVERESTRTLLEVVEKKKCEQSKEEVVERKPAVDKPKTLSSKVVVDNSKTTSPQDVAVKPKDAVERESTRTLLEVWEKKKCEHSKEEVVERKLAVDKQKTVSSKVVVDNTKSTSPQDVAVKPKDAVEGESTRTLQEVVEKKKCEQSKEEVVERKPAVDKPKTISSKVVVDNTKTTSPQDVVEKPKEKMLDTVEKESSQTLQEVVEKKKCEQSKEQAVDRKPVADKPKTVSPIVVGVEMKTSTTQYVAEKPKEKEQDIVEKDSTQTSQEIVEKKIGAQSKGEVVERKPSVDKPKNVLSKIVIDNTKTSSLPDVAGKPKDKMLDTVEKQSTQISQEYLKKNYFINEVVVEMIPSPSKKVLKKQKSSSEHLDQKQKTTSSEDLVQKYITAASRGVVDEQKMISLAVNKKNLVELKKSKSSDLLVGVVNSRTTKMVHKARQLSLESVASNSNILKVDKVKNPALGHWRIVKQDKETASVEIQSVSQSKISDRAEEENKTRLRKRSETSTDRKSSDETKDVHSDEKLVSVVSDAKPVGCSDKVQVKQQGKVAVDSKAFPCKLRSTKEENKTRLRTRSETSNERKLKDDGSSLTVVSDEQESFNNSLPEQVLVSDENTTKQTKELSSSISTVTFQKQVESSNKTSVKQCKKALSVDLKPLAQPNVPETVIEDNKLRLRTRSETSIDKKVQDIKNSSNDSTKEPTITSGTSALPKPAQNVDENAVSKEMNNLGGEPSAMTNLVLKETKTRLRARSGTNEKKLLDNSSYDKQVSESLAKEVATIEKTMSKHAKNVLDVDVKSPTRLSRSGSVQEGNKHRLRTRSETLSEKKLKKDDTSSRPINQPLNSTGTVPKPADAVDKMSVNDVYDFIDDDALSNIHTIDQFRNLSGKTMKNKRSPLPISGALEPSVVAMEDENKLNSSTRKSSSENAKVASDRNSRKSSPKKIPAKKDAIINEKVNKGNICSENKSSKSPEGINTELRKEGGSLLNSDTHSGSKEGAATRSRSRDLVNDEGSVSPTRVLRSKVKQMVANPAANTVANRIVDSDVGSNEKGSSPPKITSDQKVKTTIKAVNGMPESSNGKCDSTTGDTILSKHQSTFTKNNVQDLELEDVENPLNRRKTRSSIKPAPKINENYAHESRQLLPKMRSSVSRKLNGSPVALANEGGSVDSNIKQLKYVNSVDQRDESVLQKESLDDDDSLNDTMSLKSEKVGDELKLIIKRVKKPVQGDKTDSSIASDSDIVQKSVRETSVADVIGKENLKPVKTTVPDVVSEVLLNQSTMLSSQDNTVCNAEAVSLKTPPMGSVVTPEPDNIQAVNDMSQHREPEGAKSSTRTAQLRSLVLTEGMDRDGREQVSFQRNKDRGGKKRLARERSILDKKPNLSQSLEDLKNKSQNSVFDSPSTVEIVKQCPHYDIRSSSRNNSSSKTRSSILESNKLENPLITDSTNNEDKDSSRRRVTRSSSTSATDSLVKLSQKGDLENEFSKPRRGSNGSIVASNAIKQNNDTSESSGLKSKKVSKQGNKQTGKRLQGEFENTQTIQDEVKSKLRKIGTTVKVNSIEPESQSDSSIMALVRSKSLSNPGKKALSPKGVVLRRSSVEPSNNIPPNDSNCSADEVCLHKEKTKKDIEADVPKSSTAQDAVPDLKKDVPSKPDLLEMSSSVTPDENVASPVKKHKPEKSSTSRRKSKVISPTKKVPSDIAPGKIEIGRKTSVKEVCLASESLDKILREEDIKEVPSNFDILAQSPGKSPDSTTQSRADIVISKLAEEPLIVNTQKISEDSQGVTSTTEIETMPIILNKTQPSLVRETKIHDVGQCKKEDEGVSSTTVDSKLCAIPYSDTKFIEIKKKNVVKGSHTFRQSIHEPSAVRDKQPKKESIEKPMFEKVIPESVSKQLKGLDLEVLAVSGKKQSPSDSSVGDSDDVSPEYDVLHPRRKIWRVNPDLNKISFDDTAVKMQSCSRENETSNLKSLSDEELKRTPLKKRQVWGIQVDNNVVNVRQSDEKEDKKTMDKSEAIPSPSSSVDKLRHSIYNILSVGPADKNTPTIQKADSRSVSKEGATSSRLTNVRKTVENNCRKLSKTVSSNKSVTIKEGSCKRRRGLRKSSRLMVSFSKRSLKTKVRKPTKKQKRVKAQRTKKLVEKRPGDFCGQPHVVDKIFESPAKATELETQKSLSSNDKETVEAVVLQPKLVQNELVKPTPSNCLPSLLCNDTKLSVTIQNSLPVTHNYKELTVDTCEDEEASPQYSPLRPRDQDPISQELPVQVHSNFSGGFTPITLEWSKQSSSGSLIVPSASASGGSFIISPQATPVPRPIMERSRSFSSLGQTSKPRARRESHPALPPAVHSPTPVDLSFRRKKSRSDGSTSHLGVNPEGLMIPTNIGKLDLNGQNPTFYTSFPGDIVTYDLAENQVVCLKPTNTTCINRPLDIMLPMNVPMSDELNVTTANSSIPIRPIPIPNLKVRPAAIVAYPPFSGNKVKIDDFIPASKSSFNDYSRYLYQQPLSAFHAMKSNNASSRSPIGNQHKKADYNPLLFTHGTHFMLTPADISNMSSLCPSTSASTLTPSRRNKSTRSNRAKPDVSSSASSKISFTNPKSHENTGKTTDVRANESISQQPMFHQPEASCLPYYSGDSYNLGCVKNTNHPVLPASLNSTRVSPVASKRSYKKDRHDKSLIGKNHEALQKVVREFNEGMNSIKDSNTVSNSKERSKSNDCSNLKRSDTLSVKNVNLTNCSKSNVPVSEDVTATFNIAPPNPLINVVEMTSDQLCTDSKNAKLDHCNTVLTEHTKVTEVLHGQLSKSKYSVFTGEVDVVKVNCESEVVHENVPSSDKSQEKCDVIAGNTGITEILEEVTKHTVTNVPSVSENDSITLLDEEFFKSPDNTIPKRPKTNESSSIRSNEFCTTPVGDITSISLPTTDPKGFGNQVAKNLANFKPEENCRDKAAEEQKISVTELELSSDNLPPTTPVVPEELKSIPQHIETILLVDKNMNCEPVVNEQAVNTDHITATETQVVSDDVEHEPQPSANEEPAVLLPETPSIQLEETKVENTSDNIRETGIHITEATETKIDKSSPTHCEQQCKLLPKPETSTKSNTELPTESCELYLKPDDQIGLNKNPIEPVGTNIVHSAAPSSLTSIEQDSRLLTDQKAPEKLDACTDHLVSSEAACHEVDSVKSDSTGYETDIITTESQPRKTVKQADSDSVNTSEVSKYGESGVVSNPIQISESEETLVYVSDRLLGLADDKSVALDSTSEVISNDSSVNLDPITDFKSYIPVKLTELCSKVDIPIESGQSQEDVSKVSEAPDDSVTSFMPQNSPCITELLPDISNPNLNTLDVVNDPVGSGSNLGTSLPSPSVPNVDVNELNTPTETSVHSSTDKSVILVSAPDSDLKESFNVSIHSGSNLKGEDTIHEMEGTNDGENIDVGSSAVIINYRYGRKRKVPLDSENEEHVHSSKSFDSSTCLTDKCKKVEAKVQIRPISPTTVDHVVRSGIKINHSELQDIVKCWQEYCRSSESVQQDITVGRVESDEVTKRTGREVNIRMEPRRPAGQSRCEDLMSRPSTSRGFRNESSSPLYRPSPLISKRDPKEPKNVTAYLLEREIIKNEFIKRGQKRTCVRESFARGIKIYHRDSDVQNCGVEAFANSSRRSNAIADAMCTIMPARPAIHRSYSWILECLRERRKTMQIIESMNVQSCKDFINGVSKDALPGCRTTSRDSLAVATHSRLSGSDVPPPVTNLSPTSLGATTITVISSESEDSNPGGTEHVMKDRDEVRKRIRRKVGSFVYPSCSCPSPSQNPNSNVCPTCRQERNHAQGASSPVQLPSTPLYTKISNMQRREPERVMKCAAAVGGGEETVIVPDSDAVHLLKALMSLAGRRPPSSDTPITTYAPPCSLSCDDPVPTSHPEVFSLSYEKELLSPRVTVASDSPLHDTSPHPLPETTRGSGTRCLEQKPANEEATCLFEGNNTNLQQHSEQGIASRSQAVPSLNTMMVGSSASRLAHPTFEMDDQPSVAERTAGLDPLSCDFPLASVCKPALIAGVSQVPPTQLMSAAEDESPSTSNSSKEANRLLSRIVGKLITPDVLVDIQRLLSGEPPLKKRKE